MGSIPSPVQWIKGSSIAITVVQISFLAQELPYAAGVAVKIFYHNKKKKKMLSQDRPTIHKTNFNSHVTVFSR